MPFNNPSFNYSSGFNPSAFGSSNNIFSGTAADSDSFMDFNKSLNLAEELGGQTGYGYSDFPDDAFVQPKWQSRDEPITGSYTSQYSKMIDAANKANMWKKLTQGGGYKGGFAQGMGGSPISGGGYQALGKDKGIFQYQHAQPFAIVNHPQKQKSKGFLGTVGSMLTAAGSAGLVGPWGTAAGIGLSAIG